jgi:hypothetical protein
MHGVNRERQAGRPGRGLNGSGKSAAFGIGDVLRVRTVQAGRRNTVELHRDDVRRMVSGEPIPVRELERDVRTDEPDGTTVTIEGIHLRSLNEREIIRYIERNLATSRQPGEVWVNDHLCVYAAPEARRSLTFRPEGDLARVLGDVTLTLKVAQAPLDKDLRGVAISANGAWHEQTLAGCDQQDMAQWIFGEIDVPRLDDEVNGPTPPFNPSRRLELNPNNQVVQAVYAFIGPRIEALRQELVREKQEARWQEHARRLERHGSEIARLLNADFREFRDRLSRRRARAGSTFDRYEAAGAGAGRALVPGNEVPAREDEPGRGKGGGNGRRRLVPDDRPEAERKGRYVPAADRDGGDHGGFRVEFDSMGEDEKRAKYLPEVRTIFVNLDHPLVKAALGPGNVDDPAFRRVSYEVAFAEYAIALAHELNAEGEFHGDTSEPMVVIRETLDRVSRAGAALYLIG